jgi:hypothetical protein
MKTKKENFKTMYKFDYYNKYGMSDFVCFYPTLKEAIKNISSNLKKVNKEPENENHIQITKFQYSKNIKNKNNWEKWSDESTTIIKDYYFK